MDDPRQPDMFGHAAAQQEMFDAPRSADRKPIYSEKYGLIEPPPPGGHTPETIRAKMLKLLAEARAARTTPWPLRQTRTHMVMFPYMAEWLKDEGDQLLMEFMSEMRRLGHDKPPPLAE